MKLRWKHTGLHTYEAKGQEVLYQIERMRYNDTSRIVWVVTVDGWAPERLKNLRLAKASAQAFEDSYTVTRR